MRFRLHWFLVHSIPSFTSWPLYFSVHVFRALNFPTFGAFHDEDQTLFTRYAIYAMDTGTGKRRSPTSLGKRWNLRLGFTFCQPEHSSARIIDTKVSLLPLLIWNQVHIDDILQVYCPITLRGQQPSGVALNLKKLATFFILTSYGYFRRPFRGIEFHQCHLLTQARISQTAILLTRHPLFCAMVGATFPPVLSSTLLEWSFPGL